VTFELVYVSDGPEDLLIRASGRADGPEYESFYDGLVADPRFRRGMKIIGDFRDVDVSGLPSAAVVSIAKSVAAREAAWGPARYAIVVPNTTGFGLIRMAELTAGLQEMQVHAAYTLEDARAWLADSGRVRD
jgi:hypothetical protein